MTIGSDFIPTQKIQAVIDSLEKTSTAIYADETAEPSEVDQGVFAGIELAVALLKQALRENNQLFSQYLKPKEEVYLRELTERAIHETMR
jgi:hypothetical protein